MLRRFSDEGVQYVLVGGHAMRLNGFVCSTEDIDILLPSSIDNGRKVIRALHFLASSAELDPEWFDVDPAQPAITLALNFYKNATLLQRCNKAGFCQPQHRVVRPITPVV